WRRSSPCRWCRPPGRCGRRAPGCRSPRATLRFARGPAACRPSPRRAARGSARPPRGTSWAGGGAATAEEAEDPTEGLAQLAALHHEVDLPMLQEELGTLEALRQGLANGLGDDPRPGKADE